MFEGERWLSTRVYQTQIVHFIKKLSEHVYTQLRHASISIIQKATTHELLLNRNSKRKPILMDYKISLTKCSPNVKEACLYLIAAFPCHFWFFTGTVWHAYFIIAASCCWVDFSLFLINVRMFNYSTFIYSLVTPTITKESHNLCTKDTVCTFHV